MIEPQYIAMGALSISILGVAWQYFGGILSIRKDMSTAAEKNTEAHTKIDRELRDVLKEHSDRISDMLNVQALKINSAETKMELFWNAVGASVKSLIKQPIHFEKDQLMDKLMEHPKPEISKSELYRLKDILNDELVGLQEVKDNKSLAYALALAYIEQILYDMNYVERVSLNSL